MEKRASQPAQSQFCLSVGLPVLRRLVELVVEDDKTQELFRAVAPRFADVPGCRH
jgi:hypothetical protein